MTRRGYTFVEMLLVLAVLAVLAGIALPAVLRFTQEQAIKETAETVRRELDATRFRAIDAGSLYEFRYEMGGPRYLALSGEPEPPQTPGAAFGVTAAPSAARPIVSRQLPDGFFFEPAPQMPVAAERIPASRVAGLPDARKIEEASWSPPIVYQPDGTGANAAFRLYDARGRFVELSIRELTGMAASGPVRQREDPWAGR